MDAAEEVKLEQGTQEWHAWRDQGVGSSDASALMGFFGGMARKEAQKDMPPNARMARGTALEPHARMLFTDLTGVWIKPGCFQHRAYPFMRASLDGVSEDRKLVVEIKSPSWKVHAKALRGEVVDYYRPQCQHQLFVMGLNSMLFFSYFPDETDAAKRYAFVRVDRDESAQKMLLERALKYVQDRERKLRGQQ